MLKIFEQLHQYNYPLKSGLTYTNDFTLLVAIILSAQSKDDFINKQTTELFELYDTPERLQKLGNDFFEYIKKIGLWNNKGKNILKLCQQLIDLKKASNLKNWHNELMEKDSLDGDLIQYENNLLSKEGIPTFRLGLLTLAGVGRKTANVFLNVVYQAPVIPVDTHVIRVANRLGLVCSKNPLEIELDLIQLVPDEYKNKISHYLVWHGRKICKSIKPECAKCRLNLICPYFNNNIIHKD